MEPVFEYNVLNHILLNIFTLFAFYTNKSYLTDFHTKNSPVLGERESDRELFYLLSVRIRPSGSMLSLSREHASLTKKYHYKTPSTERGSYVKFNEDYYHRRSYIPRTESSEANYKIRNMQTEGSI